MILVLPSNSSAARVRNNGHRARERALGIRAHAAVCNKGGKKTRRPLVERRLDNYICALHFDIPYRVVKSVQNRIVWNFSVPATEATSLGWPLAQLFQPYN